MAYKRKTTKTGPNTRKSTTYSTNGPSTYSTSNKSGNTTYTYTSKDSKSYMTRTQKFAGGFVERKRIMSSSPKKTSVSRRKTKSEERLGTLGLIAAVVIVFIAIAFGG